jgi:hypothetical protein
MSRRKSRAISRSSRSTLARRRYVANRKRVWSPSQPSSPLGEAAVSPQARADRGSTNLDAAEVPTLRCGKAPRGGAYGSRRSSAVPRGEQARPRYPWASVQFAISLRLPPRTSTHDRRSEVSPPTRASRRHRGTGAWKGACQPKRKAAMTHDLDFNDSAKLGWEIEQRFEARKGDRVFRGTAAELTAKIRSTRKEQRCTPNDASMFFIRNAMLQSRGSFVASANRRRSICVSGTNTSMSRSITTRACKPSKARRQCVSDRSRRSSSCSSIRRSAASER